MRTVHFMDIVSIVALTTLLSFLLWLSLVGNFPGKRSRTECFYNLRLAYEALEVFNLENGAPFTSLSTNQNGTLEYLRDEAQAYRHFKKLAAGMANDAAVVTQLVCPRDTRAPATYKALRNKNISYFMSANAPRQPGGDWILLGDRNMTGLQKGAGVWTMTNASWNSGIGLHAKNGYVLLANGEVSLIDDHKLGLLLHASGNATNQLLFP